MRMSHMLAGALAAGVLFGVSDLQASYISTTLVQNGDFSGANLNYWGNPTNGGGWNTIIDQGINAGNPFATLFVVPDTGDTFCYQTISSGILANTNYRLVFDIVSPSNTNTGVAAVYAGELSESSVKALSETPLVSMNLPDLSVNSDTQTLNLDFNSGSATSVTIVFYQSSGGWKNLSFDNVALQVESVPEPACLGLAAFAGAATLFRRRR